LYNQITNLYAVISEVERHNLWLELICRLVFLNFWLSVAMVMDFALSRQLTYYNDGKVVEQVDLRHKSDTDSELWSGSQKLLAQIVCNVLYVLKRAKRSTAIAELTGTQVSFWSCDIHPVWINFLLQLVTHHFILMLKLTTVDNLVNKNRTCKLNMLIWY